MSKADTVKLLGNGKAYIICCNVELGHQYNDDSFFVTISFSKEEADKLCIIFYTINCFLKNLDEEDDDMDSKIETFLLDNKEYLEVHERYFKYANHDYFTHYNCTFHAEEVEIH